MKGFNIKFALLISLALVSLKSAFAQQIPMYAGYTMNNFLLSPSFAGTDESDARLMALNRLQFAGIEGAPSTLMFTGDAPIRNQRMGLGGTIYTDKYGLLRQTGVGLSYSYYISLSEETKLYFGLGGELGQLGLDFDDIRADDMTDELLGLGSASKMVVNGSFGTHISHGGLTIGFAAPQVFGTRVTYKNYASNQESSVQLERHFRAMVSYRFDVKPDVFELEPIVMMRTVSGFGPQIDINLKGIIKDNVFLALGYRSDYALSFGGGLNVSDNLMIGYSYDMAINEISGYSYGSHEFMLGYRIYKGVDRRDMEEKIEEEREQERERAKDLYGVQIEELKEDAEHQNEVNRLQKEEIEKLNDLIEEYRIELDSVKNASSKRFESDLIQSNGYDVNGDGEIDAYDDTNGDGVVGRDDFLKDKSGKVIEPKRIVRSRVGSSESPSGKYQVVIASFKSIDDAMQHQKMLKRTGDLTPTLIHQSASGTWFHVFKKGYNDPSEAQDYLNSLSTDGLESFMHPWIYVK